MTLTEYINQRRGNASALAESLGVSLARLSQAASNTASVNPERCVLIEQHTNGAVMRWDLRPDDWAAIWPELRKRKDAPAIKAEA